jgi:hypothetical protein
MPEACGGVTVVLRPETPESVPLRASVGSTEVSKSLPARVGVRGPERVSLWTIQRATRLDPEPG